MELKNTRKIAGAIVWHNKRLGMISNQNVGKNHVVVNNIDKVNKSSLKLLKIGDVVKIDKDKINELPERWQTENHMLVTKILSNGCIETNNSNLEHDGTNYSFFVRHY